MQGSNAEGQNPQDALGWASGGWECWPVRRPCSPARLALGHSSSRHPASLRRCTSRQPKESPGLLTDAPAEQLPNPGWSKRHCHGLLPVLPRRAPTAIDDECLRPELPASPL